MSEQYNLDVVFNGEDRGVAKTAGMIKKSFAFGAAAKLGSAAVSAIGSAAIGAAKDVVSVGQSFEAGMSEVASISGAAGDDLTALSDKAKEMGATTKFSATEAAEAMKYMAMAGWDTEKMLGGIGGVMNLAAASGESLGIVSDIVTDAMTAFGIEVDAAGENTTHFADVLAAASSSANTNVSMLGESFKYVAPIAGSVGYSAEDTALALSLMANSGIKASQAGTSLRSMLTNLAGGNKEAQAAAAELGVSMTDESGQMRELRDVMTDLRSAFAGLDDAQKASYASAIAGKNGMSGLLAIVGASDEDYKKLTESIDGCSDAVEYNGVVYEGAAAKMAAAANDNLAGDLTLLQSAIESVQIEIYEGLAPAMRTVVQWVTANVIPAIQKLVDWIKSIDFGKITEPFQKMNIDWGKVLGVAGAIGGFSALRSLFSKLKALNPIGALTKSSKKSSQSILKNFGAMIKSMGDGLGNAAKGLGKGLESTLNGVGKALKQANPANILAVGGAVAIAAAGFALLATQGDGVAKIISSVGDAAGKAAEGIGRGLAPVIEAVGPVAQDLGKAVAIAAQGIGEGVGRIVESFAPLLPGIAAIVTPVTEMIASITANLPAIITALSEGVSMIVQAFAPIVQTVADTVQGIIKTVGDVIARIIEAIAPYIPEITAMISTLATVFGGVATAITDAVARIIEAVAPYITEVTRMVEVTGSAIERICTVFQSLIEVIPPILEQLNSIISTIFGGLTDVLNAFGDTCESVGTGIKTAFDGVADVISAFGDAVRNVLDGIAGIIDSVGNACLNAGTGFKRLAEGLQIIADLKGWDLAGTLAAIAIPLGTIVGAASGIGDAGTQFRSLGEGLMLIATAGQQAASVAPMLQNLTAPLSSLASSAPGLVVSASAMEAYAEASTKAAAALLISAVAFTKFDAEITKTANGVQQAGSAMMLFNSALQPIGTSAATLSNGMSALAATTQNFGEAAANLPVLLMTLSAAFGTTFATLQETAIAGTLLISLAVEKGFADLLSVIEGSSKTMASAMEGAFAKMANLTGSTFGEIGAVIETQMFLAQVQVTTALEALFNTFKTVLIPLPAFVKTIVNSILAAMRSGSSAALTAGRAMSNGFASGIRSGMTAAASAARSVVSSAVNAFSGSGGYDRAYQSGRYISEGFARGLESMLTRIREIVKSIVDEAQRAIEKKAQIHSPSKLFAELGGYVGEGFAIGIESTISRVAQAASEMLDAAEPAYGLNGPFEYSGLTQTKPGDEFGGDVILEVHQEINGREWAKATSRFTREEFEKADKLKLRLVGGY